MCADRKTMEYYIFQYLPRDMRDCFRLVTESVDLFAEHGCEVSTGEIYKVYHRIINSDHSLKSSSQNESIIDAYEETYGRKNLNEFHHRYRDFLIQLSEKHVDLEKGFYELLEKAEAAGKKEKTAVNKEPVNHNNPKTEGYLRARQKKEYMDNLKASIETSDMLEGMDVEYHLTYSQLKKENGIIDLSLSQGNSFVTSEQFIKEDRLKKGYRCEALVGGIVTGKTVLTYGVVEYLLEIRPKHTMIIFVSAFSQENLTGKWGWDYFMHFLNCDLQKRGKFVIVVDGLDELINKYKNVTYEKLINACQYYNASLFFNCREKLVRQMKEKKKDGGITYIWSIQQIESVKMMETIEEKTNETSLTKELLLDYLQYPYFMSVVNSIFPVYLREKGRKLPRYCRDDFSFARKMLACLEIREGPKYDYDKEYFEDAEKLLKMLAFTYEKYGRQDITLNSCQNYFEVDLKSYQSIMESNFFTAMVQLEEDGQEIEESIVTGFFCEGLYRYFVMEEYQELLLGEEQEILLALALPLETIWDTYSLKKDMIPADKRDKMIRSIGELLNQNMLSQDMKVTADRIIKLLTR